MLPKSDVFVTLKNDGPSMDKRDKLWSMIVHGGGSKHVRIEEEVASGYFRILKPPLFDMKTWTKYRVFHFIILSIA